MSNYYDDDEYDDDDDEVGCTLHMCSTQMNSTG